MGIINGSLSQSLKTYHSPNQAELAVVVIDEKPHWEFIETAESAFIRRNDQEVILQRTKELGCRVITIDLPSRHNLLDRNPHIRSVVSNADFEFIKDNTGVLGAKKNKPIELLNYLGDHNITSLLIMGGNVDACVCDSILGYKNYPGLSTYGFNVLTAPSILSPYCKEKYAATPHFKPDARMFSFESNFKSYNPQAESKPISLFEYRFYKSTEEKQGEWPLFVFHPGVRFYINI